MSHVVWIDNNSIIPETVGFVKSFRQKKCASEESLLRIGKSGDRDMCICKKSQKWAIFFKKTIDFL